MIAIVDTTRGFAHAIPTQVWTGGDIGIILDCRFVSMTSFAISDAEVDALIAEKRERARRSRRRRPSRVHRPLMPSPRPPLVLLTQRRMAIMGIRVQGVRTPRAGAARASFT